MELDKAVKDFEDTVKISENVIEALNNGISALDVHQSDIDSSNNIIDKSIRAKEQMKDLHQVMKGNKTQLREAIVQLIPDKDEPSVELIREEVDQGKEKLLEVQSELLQQKDNRRNIEHAKREYQLQKASLPLQIDVQSTENYFKGFIKRPCGIEVVEHHVDSDTSRLLATDKLWNNTE